MSSLDEPARVTWNVMDEVLAPPLQHAPIDGHKSKEFQSVRDAVLFVMKKLSATNRTTAMIFTKSRDIQMPEIEVLYAQIKRP